jgi:phosphoribosyl 1,2-cyclic phosphodiesterase
MEIIFWGVRGSIPSPGPATVRYGGNTSCVSVRLTDGHLVIIDCGTGARNLGLDLMAAGRGKTRATLMLSHAHWDHIQGFPFFVPFYVPGNEFTVYGGGNSPALLEEILEGQMAAQFFPVQSLRNMSARIEMRGLVPGAQATIGSARVHAHANPHGATGAIAFRFEDAGKVLVYASDAGYGPAGPSAGAIEFYRGADLLIHDCTYTPEDKAERISRGLSSLDEAVECALRAAVKRVALFHYDQDYSDRDIDQIVERGRRLMDERGGQDIEILGAAEGLVLKL